MDKRKFNKKLSKRVDALQQRLDDVKRLPNSTVKSKAIIELSKQLRRVEKKIPG